MFQTRVAKLFEVDDDTGEQVRILGGKMVELKIATVLGQLSEVEAIPVDQEMLEDCEWVTEPVRLRVADKAVWLSNEQIEDLIVLLRTAQKAGNENLFRADL